VGEEPNSIAALENLERLREAAPLYRFKVDVVNVLDDYATALEHNVLVTPCLVLVDPPPRVMIAGTLKDLEKVQMALRLRLDSVVRHG
jgi:hypothetical protein